MWTNVSNVSNLFSYNVQFKILKPKINSIQTGLPDVIGHLFIIK